MSNVEVFFFIIVTKTMMTWMMKHWM